MGVAPYNWQLAIVNYFGPGLSVNLSLPQRPGLDEYRAGRLETLPLPLPRSGEGVGVSPRRARPGLSQAIYLSLAARRNDQLYRQNKS
ncbi:MAG: hypothetical protein HC875_22855 [Anaerolineales bacterium]|nr:hypothetical protein [Anaerolineales bacterium]